MAAPAATVLGTGPGLRGVGGLAHLRRVPGRGRCPRVLKGCPRRGCLGWTSPGARLGPGQQDSPSPQSCLPQPPRRPATPPPSAGAGTRPTSLAAGAAARTHSARPYAHARPQPHHQERPAPLTARVRGRAYQVRRGGQLVGHRPAIPRRPQRWREIFALNRGRPQPGGRSLTDPALIYPGSILLLPPTAHPAGPHTPPPAARRLGTPTGRHRRPPAPSTPRGGPAAQRRHVRHRGRGMPRARRPGRDRPARSRARRRQRSATAISTALVLAAVHRRPRYRPARTLTASPAAHPATAARRHRRPARRRRAPAARMHAHPASAATGCRAAATPHGRDRPSGSARPGRRQHPRRRRGLRRPGRPGRAGPDRPRRARRRPGPDSGLTLRRPARPASRARAGPSSRC